MALGQSIALFYLARGAEEGSHQAFVDFCKSYRRYRPGISHKLYVIFKGFDNDSRLASGQTVFESVEHEAIFVDDNRFDIGAYVDAASQTNSARACFINTYAEVLCDDWLLKLSINLDGRRIGLVGATGSFESLNDYDKRFPVFPNVHIRSNAFMVDRKLFCRMASSYSFSNKLEAFMFESGPRSMTRQVLGLGLRALVVGRNGRGYEPEWWPHSGTFRQDSQENLVVGDNQTRNFEKLPWPEKRVFIDRTWGVYLSETRLLSKS